MQKLRYAFFGSPRFAEIILEGLIDLGYPPEILVCNPDRPQGRKKILTPPATKSLALSSGIKVWQPDILNMEAAKERLDGLDFAIVAAYSKIIRRDVLDLFPRGVIGVHPSLLPIHRGASPIQGTILAGDDKAGTTLYLMDEKMDHGPIITQRDIQLKGSETYSSLIESLGALSVELIKDTMGKWIQGNVSPVEQDESLATFTKKFIRQDAFVDPTQLSAAMDGDASLATEIYRKIRALNPEPGVWTYSSGIKGLGLGSDKMVKLLDAEIKEESLRIRTLQVEGKNPQTISS